MEKTLDPSLGFDLRNPILKPNTKCVFATSFLHSRPSNVDGISTQIRSNQINRCALSSILLRNDWQSVQYFCILSSGSPPSAALCLCCPSISSDNIPPTRSHMRVSSLNQVSNSKSRTSLSMRLTARRATRRSCLWALIFCLVRWRR